MIAPKTMRKEPHKTPFIIIAYGNVMIPVSSVTAINENIEPAVPPDLNKIFVYCIGLLKN
jgi:hypothetical protein